MTTCHLGGSILSLSSWGGEVRQDQQEGLVPFGSDDHTPALREREGAREPRAVGEPGPWGFLFVRRVALALHKGGEMCLLKAGVVARLAM